MAHVELTTDEKTVLIYLAQAGERGETPHTARIFSALSGDMSDARVAEALIGLKSKGLIQGGPTS